MRYRWSVFIGLAAVIAGIPAVVWGQSGTNPITKSIYAPNKPAYNPGDTVTIQIKVPSQTTNEIAPADVALVADLSGSMECGWNSDPTLADYCGGDYSDPSRLASAQSVLKNFVNQTDFSKWRESLITFNYDTGMDQTGDDNDYPPADLSAVQQSLTKLRPASDPTQGNPQGVLNGIIDNYTSFGDTPTSSGITLALNDFQKRDQNGGARPGVPKYIVIATDGAVNELTCPLDSTVLGRAQQMGVKIYSITMTTIAKQPLQSSYTACNGQSVPDVNHNGVVDGEDVMKTLSDRTGGQYNYASSSTSLQNIYSQIAKQIQTALPAKIDDVVNPDIFQSINLSNVKVVDCSTGQPISPAPSVIKLPEEPANSPYTGHTFEANLGPVPNGSNYCIRFPATIKSDAPVGSNQLVDAPSQTGSFNPTDYEKGYYGDQAQGISIQNISINIQSLPDLQTAQLTLTDATGVAKSSFTVGDPIYVRVTVKNAGSSQTVGSNGHVYTAIYDDSNANLTGPNTPGNKIEIQSNAFYANGVYTYCTYSSPCNGDFGNGAWGGQQTGASFWNAASPGQHWALAYVNYKDPRAPESDLSTQHNNQLVIPYTVTAQPPANTPAWLQIRSLVGSATGDVHSNGSLVMTPGGVVQHLFKDGVAGVVSAKGTLNLDPSPTTNAPVWEATSYPPNGIIATTQFSEWASQFTDAEHLTTATVQSQPDCPNSSAAILAPGGGTVTINGWQASSQPCSVYFIGDPHGAVTDLVINADMVNTKPTVFIVSGSVKISGVVKRLDGVFMWTKNFDDAYTGPTNQSLAVNGSLIALTGSGGMTRDGSAPGLRRNLDDNSQPAETITYQPQYLDLLRSVGGLAQSTFTWMEGE